MTTSKRPQQKTMTTKKPKRTTRKAQ